MDQQYEYPLPPPPRTPGPGAPSGSGTLSQAYVPGDAHVQRRRPLHVGVPAITTDLLTAQGHVSQTPISATPRSYIPATPGALHAGTPSTLAPPPPTPTGRSPTMEPYNPRQWSHRGPVSGAQMIFQQRGNVAVSNGASPTTAHITGMEAAMPSPPPPYSPTTPEPQPPRSVAPSPMLENIGFTASPLTERSATQSPQVPMSPAFPPPPNQSSRHRERSTSGLAGQISFFSLSNLRGKQPVHSETLPPSQSTHLGPTAHMPTFEDGRPPAARRAASTGHIQDGNAAVSSSSSSHIPGPSERASPDYQWQVGMPLPGPPPGPPPPGARSQSLNRPVGGSSTSNLSSNVASTATRRRTMAPSTLGPVPPTPADFVDQPSHSAPLTRTETQAPGQSHSHQAAPAQPLHINTGANRESSLARRPARRDVSAGIRERRSKSRAARDSISISLPVEDDSKPSNLVFSTESGAISRRREHMRTASAYADRDAGVGPSNQPRSAGHPPLSAKKPLEHVLTPPYTPASGSRAEDASKRSNLRAPGSASSDRPISHLLHAPNEDAGSMPAPLSPQRPPSSGSVKTTAKFDAFALQAIERHRSFVEKETGASSDEERLELFANFIVHESRLRRDRYAAAYGAMAGEVVDLTRDMWRSYTGTSRRAGTPNTSMSTSDPTAPSWASDGQPTSAQGHVPSSASSFGDFTPNTDASSMGDLGESLERSDTRQWPEAFKPSLSPIPSMAVSTVLDGDDSRGRPASRWWESSKSGSGSIGRPDRMAKSRRETKYMGVTAASLQAGAGSPLDSGWRQGTPEASQQTFLYGPDEYPPEKVGWHEGTEYDTPIPTPQRLGERKNSASTPGLAPLDVSRLVTLPPPYPRHHPAVNNNHPRLAALRLAHRTLADHTEIQKIRDAYLDDDFAVTRDQQEASKQRRAKLRADIQSKIGDGSMSFADAAQAEADFDVQEAERGKAVARANFDVFESKVSHPLNALLTERLKDADAGIRQLQEDLETGHATPDPNRAQEEGDELPERLEKLTMLKWLFEAREQLHKDIFDFHAMRSEKYSEVILTPYRISKAQGKIDEASAFFKKDSMDRLLAHTKDAQKRFEELQVMMEKNVSRGVEDQLSAFWDIAPGLLEVIQNVPADMQRFDIAIPLQEYEENPSYREHPLQYLYSLLGHAEKSAYQFIESQINLLCLLHEVRTAVTNSHLRFVEIERRAAAPNDGDIHAEMDQARKEAESQLTHDLQDKVGEVERQWKEALGDGIEGCKGRVKSWLETTGGLEDFLDG